MRKTHSLRFRETDPGIFLRNNTCSHSFLFFISRFSSFLISHIDGPQSRRGCPARTLTESPTKPIHSQTPTRCLRVRHVYKAAGIVTDELIGPLSLYANFSFSVCTVFCYLLLRLDLHHLCIGMANMDLFVICICYLFPAESFPFPLLLSLLLFCVICFDLVCSF